MLDIRRIRENTDELSGAIARRGKAYNLGEVLSLDERRRAVISEVETLRARKNEVSKQIPILKKSGEDTAAVFAEMKEVGVRVTELETELSGLEERIKTALLTIPNAPHESVPDGTTDTDNKLYRTFSEPTKFEYEPLPHWEIGTKLDILDFEMGAKVTGARFTFYKGLGARLERSIINLMLDTHTENGFTEVFVPFIANEKSLTGTGQLPKFAEDMFHLENTNYYLIPTAEVPVTNMYREEILEGDRLPIWHCAYSACFRSEAGSAGRDTRGLIRQHQFNKVELVKFCQPENSYDELEKLLESAEKILQILKLPYRVVTLCAGDMGFSSAKTYDIEVYMPSYGRYVEISSCSNFEDFQARRAGIRYKKDTGSKPEFVHTLNGSGLAVGRTVAAIMENYQTPDGHFTVPEALRKYMGVERV